MMSDLILSGAVAVAILAVMALCSQAYRQGRRDAEMSCHLAMSRTVDCLLFDLRASGVTEAQLADTNARQIKRLIEARTELEAAR